MNIKQALQSSMQTLKSHNIPSATLDAEVLLLETLNKTRKNNRFHIRYNIPILHRFFVKSDSEKLEKSWIYIHNNYVLSSKEEELFNKYIDQRIDHKPIAYIIKRKEFFGYDYLVNKSVLIPRPETEIIVEEVLKIIKSKDGSKINFNLLDIGTGSGCILISILNELQKNNKNKIIQHSFAIDISKKAIKIAKINAKKYNLGKKIKFIKGNLKNKLNQKLFTSSNDFIITANLPYITKTNYENLSINVKNFEPKIALTSGVDGLDDINNMLKSIFRLTLKCNQTIYLIIEADPDQIDIIKEYIGNESMNIQSKIILDLSEKERVITIKITN